MALRQTIGYVESLLCLIGLNWEVPDFSTLSRRQKTFAANIPHRGSQGPLHLLIDSTGIKAEGEGEWNARKHGGAKRRVWHKGHLGIDKQTREIRAVEVTSSDISDAPILPELLSQIPPKKEIASVTADGAYDTQKCHDAIAKLGAQAVIPPRKNAKPWKTETAGAARHCPRSATRRCVRPNTWDARSGDDGVDITTDATQRRKCTASSCWVSASWRGTWTARSRSSRSVLNGYTTLGIPVTKVAG
jgi:hypothetical protein